MIMRRHVLFPLFAGAFAAVLLAQQTAETSDDRTFRTTVREVVAPTVVLDKDGSYVAGLKPSEFRLYDNNKQQAIQVNETFAPVSLVVAVQANAKVEGVIPKLQKIGALLHNMVAGDQSEVAILAFDHRLQVLQDFTGDTDKLDAAMKKLAPGSSSSRMNDAVIEAARMLGKRPKDRRRVVLLISESRDYGSEGKVRDALTAVEINNIMVYALNMSRLYTELTAGVPAPRPDPIPATARHLPAGAPQTPTMASQIGGRAVNSVQFIPVITEIFRAAKAIFVDNPVEIYTKYTGGKEHPFVTQRDLERVASDVGRELANQYLITYNPNNKEEGGFHSIVVKVMRPNLEVRTRDGYWMAAVQ